MSKYKTWEVAFRTANNQYEIIEDVLAEDCMKAGKTARSIAIAEHGLQDREIVHIKEVGIEVINNGNGSAEALFF